MHLHDLVLAFLAFISEFLGTLSGFGSSTFFVPSAIFFESFKFVLALTAILHCFGNLFKLVLFRQDFKWTLFFKFALPSVFFTAVGAMMTIYFSADLMIYYLGVMLIIFSILSLLGHIKANLLPKWVGSFLIILSGFSTGFVGTGGALRGLALSALNLHKNNFVALSSAIDIGGDFIRACIYIKNGYMDWSQWFYIPLLVVAAFMGASLGKKVLNKINQTQFEKIVAVFIFISGVTMLLDK